MSIIAQYKQGKISIEELASKASEQPELQEEIKKILSEELSPEDLEKVAGGAYPTAVNNQITDSVTQ